MAKIIKLVQDISFYYDMAVSKSDAGDYIACLDFLNQALKTINEPYCDDELAVRMEIAETYSLMGLYNESNREYFKMTSFDYCLDEVFYGIMKNFALMEMTQFAAYYLNLGIEMGVLDTDDGFTPIDMDIFNKEDTALKLVKPQDNEYIVNLAKQLMTSNDIEYARQMLSSVPSSSSQYREAVNCLALIEISDGNIDKGLKYCNDLLKTDDSDLYALTTKILGLNLSGEKTETQRLMSDLDALDINTWPELLKVTMCASEIGDNLLTKKYTDRILKIMPYDRDMLILNALSNINTGQKDKAKAAIIKAAVIYPHDYTIRNYAYLIDNADENSSNFPLTSELEKNTKQQYLDLIEENLISSKNEDEFAQKLFEDETILSAVMWGLNSGNVSLATRIGTALAKSKKSYVIVRELMLDPSCGIITKKAMFLQLMKKNIVRVISMVINNQLQYFRPSVPKVTNKKEYIGAYCRVYSTLAFIENNFDRRLNIWYKKIVAVLAAEKDIKFKENAIAAVIAFKSGINKIFLLNSYCCEVFDCEMEDFMLYCNLIDEKSNGNSKLIKKTKQRKKSN